MSQDPLLQPFRLGPLELRNRIVSASHEPAYSEDGLPGERYLAYHREKARGGIAMTMIGGSAVVAPDSPPAFGNLDLTGDRIIPCFRRLADAVHAHGTAVTCQITHLGRRTSNYTGHWLPLVAPSGVREPAHRAFPKIAEDEDIERIIRAYGAAARRCREGGLDGVEIQAYGHLLDSFWSPLTNHRNDRWGGSLDNRLRMAHAVIDEIRAQAGYDFLVGIRMVFDEQRTGGLSAAEGLEIGRRLTAGGRLDFVSVIKGHIDTDEGLSHVIANMGAPSAPHLDFAGEVRAALGVPVMHSNRINDVATARYAIREGKLDLVAMTRAHLADPHIVARIQAGAEQRIRPCVGAGYCIDRIYEGGEALCIHNAATGREQYLPQSIPAAAGPARRVVVVGAGPAGLEAARVCAARGHRVTVFEAGDQPGGQIRLAAVPARRRELLGIVDWLAAELEHLGGELRCNVYAEADEVLAEDPDVVIVATGGLPNTGFLAEGAELAHSTWDVLGGHVRLHGEVLLYDDNGQHPGFSCAEHICGGDIRLEIVTPERMVAQQIGGTNFPAYLRAFYRHGVTLTPDRYLTGLTREADGRLSARLYNDYTGAAESRRVDHVIVEHGTAPLDEVYEALKPTSRNHGEVDLDALLAGRPQTLTHNPDGRYQLFRLGDAVASRNIHAAIYDALRLCKDL